MLSYAWFVAVLAFLSIKGLPIDYIRETGLIIGWIPETSINGIISAAINTVIISIIGILLVRLNTLFPLMKEHTYLPIVFFLLLEMSTASLINHFSLANVAALSICLCIFILYTCYQQGSSPEQSFVIAFLFSITSLFYARILYILPIFIIGFHQMRALSIRTIIAFIIGLITPYWIIWGLGWVEYTQLDSSNLSLKPQWIKPSISLIPTIFVTLLGLFTGTSNLLNAHTEKIQTRAYNGFINLLSVYTALLICIDHEQYETYLPILNMSVSLQSAYYFANKHNRINTILFYSIITLLFSWQIWTLLAA